MGVLGDITEEYSASKHPKDCRTWTAYRSQSIEISASRSPSACRCIRLGDNVIRTDQLAQMYASDFATGRPSYAVSFNSL